MPTVTVTEDIEIKRSGNGRGGEGKPPGGDGGGGGNEGGAGRRAVPQRTYVTGMTVALGAILMFFMALVSAYIVRKGTSNDWRPLEVPRILWLNTAVLVFSSLTLSRSRKRFLEGDQSAFRHWWLVSCALGVLFLAGQIIAWLQLEKAGVFLATNPSSSFFYVFTAAHGLHLLGGVLALFWVAVLPLRRLTQGTATAIAAMYWHFMDGLWVFIFLLLLLGR
jgi:cytochrome c oxidase subunit III